MKSEFRMQNDECRMKTGQTHGRVVFCVLYSAFCIGLGLVVPGCAAPPTAQPTTRPASMHDRQERAMRDPFGYSPDMGKTDISGGGLTEFDRDAMGKDLKNVFDP
jgi:hypothetical protein